jgi:trigger factor
MSVQQTEFKNDNVQVIVSRSKGSRVKLEINVSPLATQAAYKQAIKAVGKEISMPGFRKGKAPDNYILQNYKGHVESEWNNILLNTSFQEALDLTKIYPFSKNSVEKPQVKEISLENGSKVSMEYETTPEVPSIDFSKLNVKKHHPKPVTEQQKNDVITQIKLSHATWHDAKDEPVAVGDYVDLDIYNMDEKFDICKDNRFCVEEGKIGKWLIDLLINKKVGETVTGLSENEHDHSAESCDDPSHDHSSDHDFKPTNCKITIKGHFKAELPELDDALASKAGAPNVEELLVRIEKSLEKREENSIKQKQIREIEKQLQDQYVFDIPHSLLKQEAEKRYQHALHHLDKDLNKDELQKKREELQEKAFHDVESAYRLYFITEKVAADNNISVSQEEIMQEFMKQMVNPQTAIISQDMPPEEIRSRLSSFIISEKSRELMVEKANQID